MDILAKRIRMGVLTTAGCLLLLSDTVLMRNMRRQSVRVKWHVDAVLGHVGSA